MNYSAEELLPVVVWLTERYTSRESTSIPYRIAQQLMGAVIYSIHEYEGSLAGQGVVAVKKAEAQLPLEEYKQGVLIIKEKAVQAAALYSEIIEEFEDYGCRNYHDTIVKGIPAFFQHYDVNFNPQDHILTLDYPVIKNLRPLQGVDLILSYLQEIRKEERYLSRYEPEQVREILEGINLQYEELFLDNIAEAVIRRV